MTFTWILPKTPTALELAVHSVKRSSHDCLPDSICLHSLEDGNVKAMKMARRCSQR